MLAALTSGIAVHCFALTNLMHNYDNILQQPKGYGAGITSGRWLLEVLGDINDALVELNYNLPTMNGLGFLLLIALSTAVVVNFLRIRNPVSAVLTGCLMATFPTVCATLVFRYTAPYYGLSLLLAVLSAWVVDRWKFGFVLSALCLAASMGIYQAYPPFTISLFVLILLRDSLDENAKLTPLIRQGLRYCFSLMLGVVLYFLFLKLSLALYSLRGEVVLDSYQGINSMGQLNLSELPWLVKKAWVSAVFFPVKDLYNLASVRPLKVLWVLLVMVTLMQVLYILIKRRIRPDMAVFCAVMCLLLPLAINFIVIMAPQGIIYTIMVYSFVLVGVTPIMLLECMPCRSEKKENFGSWMIGIILTGIILYNGYYANVNYTSLYYANRQVENFVNGLMIQVRMTEGYTPEKEWVFVGDVDKFMLYDMWHETPYYGGITGSTAQGLFNAAYSRDFWFASYLGNSPLYASEEERITMIADSRVEQMPCWPENGCIQVIDDYVVVKFQQVNS